MTDYRDENADLIRALQETSTLVGYFESALDGHRDAQLMANTIVRFMSKTERSALHDAVRRQ